MVTRQGWHVQEHAGVLFRFFTVLLLWTLLHPAGAARLGDGDGQEKRQTTSEQASLQQKSHESAAQELPVPLMQRLLASAGSAAMLPVALSMAAAADQATAAAQQDAASRSARLPAQAADLQRRSTADDVLGLMSGLALTDGALATAGLMQQGGTGSFPWAQDAASRPFMNAVKPLPAMPPAVLETGSNLQMDSEDAADLASAEQAEAEAKKAQEGAARLSQEAAMAQRKADESAARAKAAREAYEERAAARRARRMAEEKARAAAKAKQAAEEQQAAAAANARRLHEEAQRADEEAAAASLAWRKAQVEAENAALAEKAVEEAEAAAQGGLKAEQLLNFGAMGMGDLWRGHTSGDSNATASAMRNAAAAAPAAVKPAAAAGRAGVHALGELQALEASESASWQGGGAGEEGKAAAVSQPAASTDAVAAGAAKAQASASGAASGASGTSQCAGWSPNAGAFKGLGGSCAKWGGSTTEWCYVEKDFSGAARDFMTPSAAYMGKFVVPCRPEAVLLEKSGPAATLHSRQGLALTKEEQAIVAATSKTIKDSIASGRVGNMTPRDIAAAAKAVVSSVLAGRARGSVVPPQLPPPPPRS
eukprot:TRINITY_DN83137_c0_g1_i1.p1 TRINITY_DN83137_c0_g1~~TRINITY_DN83137_c0_g1_i1.p1  ORF type:complete len:595 (+),score=210.41 TRINITY_DN83137_c0_g1_i1:93-1877(+)